MLYRVGIVSQIDPVNALARVNFPDHDNVESNWLAVLRAKTLKDREYWMPDISEQVVCLLDEHEEDGCILGAIYSQADATPTTNPDLHIVVYMDGATWSYDRSVHQWALSVPEGGQIQLSCGASSIQVTNDSITISRNGVTITISESGIVVAGGSAEKLGFWGADPVTQPGAIVNPVGGAVVDVQARIAIAGILSLLAQTGLMS